MAPNRVFVFLLMVWVARVVALMLMGAVLHYCYHGYPSIFVNLILVQLFSFLVITRHQTSAETCYFDRNFP